MHTAPYTSPGLRSDRVYDELKTGLLSGDFPLNVRLGEERIAAHLGVSRTPVREALARLHSECLVQRLPDGGLGPNAPDITAAEERYEVRLSLECLAIRRPLGTGLAHDQRRLADLRAEWEALSREVLSQDHRPDAGFVLLDESFHVKLAEAAGNAVLTDLLRTLNERIRIVRMQDFVVVGRIAATVAEHLAILDALDHADYPVAEALLVAHIKRSQVVVRDRVVAAAARMASAGPVSRW